MAIAWDVTVTPLNVDRKEASVVAIRTDDTNPLDIKTETHTIITAILATQAQKIAMLDQIWQQHLDWQNKISKIDDYVGTIEQDAKTNLEARE